MSDGIEVKVISLDQSPMNTGVCVSRLTNDMRIPEIVRTFKVKTPSIERATALDVSKITRIVKNEISNLILEIKPNMITMEEFRYSYGRFADSLLFQLQGVLYDLVLDLHEYLAVPFPILIAPIQSKKWVDCSKRIYDNLGRNIKGPAKKKIYIDHARETLKLSPDISADEIEAIIMGQIALAWAMPDSRFRANLSLNQKEVVEKIEQEGESEFDRRGKPIPGLQEILGSNKPKPSSE